MGSVNFTKKLAITSIFSVSLFYNPLVWAESNLHYSPFEIKVGGTGGTNLTEVKENLGIPTVTQTAGQSQELVMSQKAVTDAIAAGSGGGIVVTQETGQSTTMVMSQKAVTDAIDLVTPNTVVQTTGQSTEDVMSQKAVTDAIGLITPHTVVQTTGQSTEDIMSQKAVTDAIDNIPSVDIVQTTGQSLTAVMSQKAVTDAMLTAQTILNMVYPVGSIYMSTGSTSPALLFGGGWERIEDKFLLASGPTYTSGGSGGSENVTLTESNLPSHTHGFSATTGSSGSHTHNVGWDQDGSSGSVRYTVHHKGASGAQGTGPTSSSGSHTHSVSGTTNATGSGTSFSIMPPYISVNMWKRIS